MSASLRRWSAWPFAATFLLVAGVQFSALCYGEEPVGLAAAAPQSGGPQERYVLLTNGQVLRGRVMIDGDRYVVSTPTTDMRLPADAVEHVCQSLVEGYQLKRADMLASAGRDRARLIHWCLAQGLLDQAETELREAQQQADANNPRYDLLRRRVKLAREPARPAPPPVPPAQPPTSDSQLDVLVRTLPGPAVETFSQTVQPLLLKNCAAAGCHGASPRSDFQLIRLAQGITPTRKVTQRNLQATLAWINRNDPEKSRLLTEAAKAHGNTAYNKFEGTDGPVFRHLAQWVQQVSRPNEALRPDTVQPTETTLSQSIPAPSAARLPATALRRNLEARSVAGPLGRPANPPAAERAVKSPGSMNNAPPPAPESADPFDPEQFNRRYHGEASAEQRRPPAEPGDE